jgi:hypothetical protein
MLLPSICSCLINPSQPHAAAAGGKQSCTNGSPPHLGASRQRFPPIDHSRVLSPTLRPTIRFRQTALPNALQPNPFNFPHTVYTHPHTFPLRLSFSLSHAYCKLQTKLHATEPKRPVARSPRHTRRLHARHSNQLKAFITFNPMPATQPLAHRAHRLDTCPPSMRPQSACTAALALATTSALLANLPGAETACHSLPRGVTHPRRTGAALSPLSPLYLLRGVRPHRIDPQVLHPEHCNPIPAPRWLALPSRHRPP